MMPVPPPTVEIVRQAVVTVCRADLAALTPHTRSADVKGWDSFGRLQVILELERMIGRELPLERAMAAASIWEIAAIVAETLP